MPFQHCLTLLCFAGSATLSSNVSASDDTDMPFQHCLTLLWVAGSATLSSDVSASVDTDMPFQPEVEHFPPYQWRNDHHSRPTAPAPAAESPAASESSLTASDEEEEGLPTSLSGMARHFQNQLAVRHRHRRRNGTAKAVR